MESILTVRKCILSAVGATPQCELDDLATAHPEVSGTQWFLEIDQLIHEGEIQVTQPQFCRFILKSGPNAVSQLTSCGQASSTRRCRHDCVTDKERGPWIQTH